ncbi:MULTISPECIES: hypothetical protein [unclassified Wolbachia]|uniref:hypothetical protein n=1 Tax=unclassified Wolbachia TaxID=2640676 RepID=UPI003132AAEB
MKTPKLLKSIAKKFKNSTAAKEQEQKVSSNADSAEAKKPLEDVLNEKTARAAGCNRKKCEG